MSDNFRKFSKYEISTYIAGFFDAEGTIALQKDKRYDSFSVHISIKQTWRPVLDYINNFFHGTVSKYKSKYENRKDSYRWLVLKQDQLNFLECIYPTLIEKKKQAELMLQYLKVRPEHRNYFRASQSQRQLGEYISKELTRLKHEKYNQRQLTNYTNEIKKLKIPKAIREGKQSTLIPLDEIYEELQIENNKIDQRSDIAMPDKISIGYFSGFYDGEGYVGITKGHRDSYTLRVAVTNSNIDILNLYMYKFGGNIRPKSNKNAKEFHKQLYLWENFNNASLPFLKSIYPHTKVKKEQIYFAMKFQEWHNVINVIKTSDQKKMAEYYMLKLIKLKKEIDEDEDEYSIDENLDEFQSGIDDIWS